MKLNNIFYMLLVAVLLSACSASRKAGKYEDILESRKCWVTEYDSELCDINLKCSEVSKFKDGKYIQFQSFYLPGERNVLFTVTTSGKYNVEYDSELEAFFINEDLENLQIENKSTDNSWFKRFDREIRVNYYGDAYDNTDIDEDDDTLYGLQIIECTGSRLLLKDLEDREVYDYTPSNLNLIGANLDLIGPLSGT